MGMRGHLFINREDLREALQQPSSRVLIAVNLGLIAAMIAWDREVFDIVFLYWAENLVFGAINVLKMAFGSALGLLIILMVLKTRWISPHTGPNGKNSRLRTGPVSGKLK